MPDPLQAPEVLFCPVKKTPDAYKTDPGARHYNVSADIWAVGVLAYELLVGQPPFRSKDMQSTAMAIVHGEVSRRWQAELQAELPVEAE